MMGWRKSPKNIAILAAVGLATGWASACAQPPSPRRDGARSPVPPAANEPDANGSRDGRPTSAPVPAGLQRHNIAVARAESLPFELRSAMGGRSIVLAADEPDAAAGLGLTHLRRLDEQGQLGPIRSLRGRRLVAGLDRPRSLLVTSDGSSICIEASNANAPPRCHERAADFVVPLGDHVALFSQRPPEDEEEPETEPSQRGAPVAEPAPPERVRLVVELFDERGEPLGDPYDSGLELGLPLATMGVIAVAAEGEGARVLWYDHLKPRKEGRRWIPRARLYSGWLASDGKLVASSRRLLHEGDRAYGHVEGHEEPRLLSDGEHSIYLGRRIDERGGKPVAQWEAARLAPWGALPIEATVVALDPLRLAGPNPLEAAELAFYVELGKLGPAPAPYLAPHEPGRVAWLGERGWFTQGGALRGVKRGDPNAQGVPHPFEARRSRLWWSTINGSGEGLAFTSDGLVTMDRGGSVAAVGPLDDPGLSEPLGPAAKIGDSWWVLRRAAGQGSGATLQRLLPTPLQMDALAPHAQPGSAVVTGGVDGGLFIALAGARLGIWRLGADGSQRQLAVYESPFGPDLVAAPRRAGGALVAGHARGAAQRIVVAAIDERGQLLAVHPSTLAFAIGDLQLLDGSGGGALLIDRRGRRLGWHDDDGRELSTANWPDDDGGAACLDGAPMRRLLPSPEPGMLVRHDALATADSCVDGVARVLGDGSVRWFGSAPRGLDSAAEVGIFAPPEVSAAPAPNLAPGPTAPPARLTSPAPALSKAPCPADMVSVAGRYCIDRFEARLMDASSGIPLSADYPSTPNLTSIVLGRWTAGRWLAGDLHARAMPLPPLGRDPAAAPRMLARGAPGVVPSGYVTGLVAARACAEAGKRLCTHQEWLSACRGEQDRDFPYGDSYEQGSCNVFRYAHPAASLHGSAAIGHLDPRLNRVREAGRPLLQPSGASPRCSSRWGDDAIYDMVGNLDEWVDEKGGAFAGGFYSRSTRKGCDALITAHPRRYLDYSLGIRCCLSASR